MLPITADEHILIQHFAQTSHFCPCSGKSGISLLFFEKDLIFSEVNTKEDIPFKSRSYNLVFQSIGKSYPIFVGSFFNVSKL